MYAWLASQAVGYGINDNKNHKNKYKTVNNERITIKYLIVEL
jgi:hypothetical protein